MIGFVRGTVAGRSTDSCLIDVSGVGYRLHCSSTTLAGLPTDGETTQLWTHVHAREDLLALYGFASEAEHKMFEALLGVSSVGPKMALAICSAFSPEAFRKALVTDDLATLSSVSGVGKKTAQRILLDLKEKLELPDLAIVGSQPDTLSKARSALENLGYSAGEVRVALSEVETNGDGDVEAVIRSALKVLA
ncbi:MAG: Holliday junction branch migration protein RuvA [Actinomycetota bacterium]